jgi:hypothetical protein
MATFLLAMSTTVIRFRERHGSGVKKEEELFWYHYQGQSGSCSVIRGRAITAWAAMSGREDITMGLGTVEKVNDGRDTECSTERGLDTRQKT